MTYGPDDTIGECPKCSCEEIHRDEVDVGVGVIYGPYGCPICGWSQDPEYDRSEGQNPIREDGSVTDQYGGLWPKDSPMARAMRLAEGKEKL